MRPQDYKGKTVQLPTGDTFVVTGGVKKKGEWFLKHGDSCYPIEDCLLVGANEDFQQLKNCTTLEALTQFHATVGQEVFTQTWLRLEGEPVEAAAVAILYCSDWYDFCVLTEQYLVSAKYPELNKKFRQLLKHKGLDRVVTNWYKTREVTHAN